MVSKVYLKKIFTNHKLKNCIVSKTDNTPLDLGHTFPKLELIQSNSSLTIVRNCLNIFSEFTKTLDKRTKKNIVFSII